MKLQGLPALLTGLTLSLMSSPVSSAPVASDPVAVRAAWLQALAAADEDALDRVLASDFSVVESSGNVHDRSFVIDRAKLPPLDLRLDAGAPTARRSANLVTLSGPVTESRGGTRIVFNVTDVLVRSPSGWRIAHSHWTRAPDAVVEAALGPAELDRMVGNFRTPRGGTLVVERQGARLLITEPGGNATIFRVQSPTTIVGPDGRIRWLFLDEANGQFARAVIAGPGQLTPVARASAR